MTTVELLILLMLVGGSITVTFVTRQNRDMLLWGMSAVATVASGITFYGGRSIALPVLLISFFLLIVNTVTWLRGVEGRCRPIVGALTFALSVIAFSPLLIFSSKLVFPMLEGSYEVGVRSAEVEDAVRGNAWDAINQGPRRILIRLWYPAAAIPEGALNHRHPPVERAISNVFSGPGFDPYKLIGEALLDSNTNAYWDAPAKDGSFPLLVFSHGYGGHIATNSVVMEQLASRGYVVVSITHPGESSSLVYLDGQPMPQAPERGELLAEHAATGLFDAFFLDTEARMGWVIDTFETIEMISGRFPIWARDFQSVVSALEQREFTGDIEDVLDNTDFNAVGYLGMSAGGGSATAACHTDSRCIAVAALDGGLGLPFLRDTHIRTPALIFDSGIPKRLGAQDLYYEPHSEFGRNSQVFRIVFPDNGHADFTDLALALSPIGKAIFPKLLPILGPVDGPASIQAQSRLTARFFDIYLKGELSNGFPELELQRNPVAKAVDPEPFRAWADSRSHSARTTPVQPQ